MKVATLITWNWGSVDNREWQMADTVLLTGESGSGKSTLLDSLQTLLTAAHNHIVQFNVGQDESTQSRKGGKEPRTLQAYALGQQAEGVFLRSRSTSFVAAVIVPSEAAGESAEPFTALVGVEAHEDSAKAQLTRPPMYFIVRRPLSLEHLLQPAELGKPASAIPLKELYTSLQARLRAGSEVVQRYEDKTSYLSRLYGATMGKASISDLEAHRAAKSLVKAMAYKELGNVNDLVRDEILDFHDLTKDLETMRSLMKTIAGLHEAAKRLNENMGRLRDIDEAASKVVDDTRKFVVNTIAHAIRAVADAERDKADAKRGIEQQERKNAQARDKLLKLGVDEDKLKAEQTVISAELAQSNVAVRKNYLEQSIRNLSEQFDKDWKHFKKAAGPIGTVITALQPVALLDAPQLPRLQECLELLRPLIAELVRMWGGGLSELAKLQPGISTSLPAFDVEAFDQLVSNLDERIRGEEGSLAVVTVEALSTVSTQLTTLGEQKRQREKELQLLQEGKSSAHEDVHVALALLAHKVPEAKPQILSSLVEPIKGSKWQNAIEGYIGNDRFAIIVEAGYEAQCTRVVKERFRKRSPKVAQGTKAMEDTASFRPDAKSIVLELQVKHPVARAFLHALYGRTKKVADENELSRTSSGLMQEGVGSRAYGMFSCWVDDTDLAFGEENRKLRIRYLEGELRRIAKEAGELVALQKDLLAVSRAVSGVSLASLSSLLTPVLEAQRRDVDESAELASLDTSSIAGLLERQKEIEQGLAQIQEQRDAENRSIGANDGELGRHTRNFEAADRKLPGLQVDKTNAMVWASRFASVAGELVLEHQLIDEAKQESESEVRLDTLKVRAETTASNLGSSLKNVTGAVYRYLTGARTDDERFRFNDPPKNIERLEDILKSMLELSTVVTRQLQLQAKNGLADNEKNLQNAEARFNAVFTSSFCLKVRDEIRDGGVTLSRLNRELKNIQFGYDTFELEYPWVPRLQKVYEFFEAVEGLVDTLEKEKGSIFESQHLSGEHRATANHIKDLLLTEDLGQAERHLKELADYRNYRRYDIIRRNKAGMQRLSTWGTGSGGELETPFYVIRAAVLSHALGHFGRERKGAPSLRLMLSDEAFSKMDESRSRSVLQFLSKSLGLQLIVAMPTSKSGAVKPEFEKEFTFSKVLASRDGTPLFVSEVQEKLLKNQAMKDLWQEYAAGVRKAAAVKFEEENPQSIQTLEPETEVPAASLVPSPRASGASDRLDA